MKYNFTISLQLLCSFLLISAVTHAQTITFTGQVIDDDTEEGIPFCSVFLDAESPLGVTTDVDGIYTIILPISQVNADSIAAVSMGYSKLKKAIKRDSGTQVINFRLRANALSMMEVEIVAGENPANEIVRRIVKGKARNQPKNFDAFEVEMYTKMELDLNNIDPKMKDSPLFKELQFIFENVDSVSDVRPFLPAYVAERLYDVYHIKKSGAVDKEMLKAQKVSGVNNSSVVDFINRLHEQYSIYDNLITLLGKEFVSPFANQGLGTYEYYILDSTYIQGHWSYKLKFKPKRKAENTFYGDFWVSMEDYGVEMVNMRMSPDVNVNLVQRVIIYQEFQRQDSLWLPFKEKTVIDFAADKKEKKPGIIGRKTQMYRGFNINDPGTPERYKKLDPEDINPKNVEVDNAFWQEHRHEELSKNEEQVYTMVDSIKNVPVYKTMAGLINTLATGYQMLGPLEIGPYSEMININDVEGWRFGLGLGTSTKFSKKLRLYGYGAYGLHDKSWKWKGLIHYVFDNFRRHEIGIIAKDDVSFENKNSEEALSQGLFAGFLRRKVPAKIMRVSEYKFFYEYKWKKGVQNRLALLYRNIRPFGDEFTISGNGFNYGYYPNLQDTSVVQKSVTTAELVFKTRFAYKERLLRGNFSDVSLGSEFPVVEFTYTGGFKGILNSQYNYHRLHLSFHHWFYVGTAGWLKYTVDGGKIFGQVPYLLLETHPGNEAYFYNSNAFNMMNSFEFVSDAWVGLRVVHHFDGFFFNRIPLLRKLKLREVAFFRAAWGSLSDANMQANILNHQSNGGPFYGRFDKGPYMEAGFGIENILKVIRVDALWRLNYWSNENAQKFSLRVTLDFYF